MAVRRALAQVSLVADHLRRRLEGARRQDLGRAVGGSVVDDHELGDLRPLLHGVEQPLERALLVVDRDQHGELRHGDAPC
jgi:hypothetical protein